MRWSCLPVSLFAPILQGEMTVEDWAVAAKEMGMDAIDLSILFVKHRTPAAIGQLKQQLARAQMPVAMITTYPDFSQPDPMQRERELSYAISDIATAAELGAEYLRITAGQYYPGQDDDETIKHIVSCFETCCKYAERWGVKLLMENHSKPGAWEREDFDFCTERFLKLVEASEGLPIGINFDTANTYADGANAMEVFRKVYHRVETIHVNDLKSKSPLTFCGIGDGSAPVLEIFQIAKEKGFKGLLSIEEVGGAGLDGIRKSFANSKSLWEQA